MLQHNTTILTAVPQSE